MSFRNVVIYAGLSMIVLVLHGLQCEEERRLLLHSNDDIAMEFQMLRQEIAMLKANQSQEIAMLKANQSQESAMLKANHSQDIAMLMANQSQEISMLKANYTQDILSLKSQLAERGATYIRWGRTTCAGNNTVKVYSGFTAGSPYDVQGGAASFVCLPENPTWATYLDGIQNIGGQITGTEFEPSSFQPFPRPMTDEDAPCVLCNTPRSVTVMIPGRTDCYQNWTLEYTGYLMTGYKGQAAATDYACVDADPEAVLHGEASQNGKLIYFTEVKCGSLPCQEYPNGRELACVVCSK